MKKTLQILLFFLLLLWGATSLAVPGTSNGASSIHKADAPAKYPVHLPGSYGTPFKAEIINHSRTVQTASSGDQQDASSDNEYHENDLRPYVSQPIAVNTSLWLSARIKKLIFPFHTYL